MRFNNENITLEAFNQAKQYYIDLNLTLINQVKSGELKVNDPENYIKNRENNIQELKEMIISNNFTILQRAYYFQTGECVALLK